MLRVRPLVGVLFVAAQTVTLQPSGHPHHFTSPLKLFISDCTFSLFILALTL